MVRERDELADAGYTRHDDNAEQADHAIHSPLLPSFESSRHSFLRNALQLPRDNLLTQGLAPMQPAVVDARPRSFKPYPGIARRVEGYEQPLSYRSWTPDHQRA